MKKLKNLLIVLMVIILCLVFSTSVQAANKYVNLYLQISSYDEAFQNAATSYVVSENAKLKLSVYGVEYNEVESTDEGVATFDSTTGEVTIHSVGTCQFKVTDADTDTLGTTVVTLKVLSASNFEKALDINKTLMYNVKISGDQAKWYPEGELSKFDIGEMIVGSTAYIVDSEGNKLADKYDSIEFTTDASYMTVDANGLITVNEVGEYSDITVTVKYEGLTFTREFEVDGVTEFTDLSEGGPFNQGSQGESSEKQPVDENSDNGATDNESKKEAEELDDEPKAGLDTTMETSIVGIALISLAIAIIAKKH